MFRIKTALLACLLLVACFTSGISSRVTPETEMTSFGNFLTGHNAPNEVVQNWLNLISQIKVQQKAKNFKPLQQLLIELHKNFTKHQAVFEVQAKKHKVDSSSHKKLSSQIKGWLAEVMLQLQVSPVQSKQVHELEHTLKKLLPN